MSATDTISKIDGFIHEPARLRILAPLSVLGRADFMYILHQVGLGRGNLSVQMTKLEEAQIFSVEKELVDARPRTTYALTTKGRQDLLAYKQAMEKIIGVLPRRDTRAKTTL